MRWVVRGATLKADSLRVALFSSPDKAKAFIENNRNLGLHGNYIFKKDSLLGEFVHAWVEEEPEVPLDP